MPLQGPPRVVRTRTINLSRRGLFVQANEPLPPGTLVALSLEAGGQTLPFAEAQVVWARPEDGSTVARASGFGVRFERFLHPRGEELVDYLVRNLDRGRPLTGAPPRRRWRRKVAALAAALGLAGVGTAVGTGLWAASSVRLEGRSPASVATPALVASVTDEGPQPNEGGAGVGGAPEASEALAPAAAPPEAGEPTGQLEATALGPLGAGETRGAVDLPSGAASALTWALADQELRLAVAVRGGHLRRAFLLEEPPRLVFDVDGASPEKSYALAGARPYLKQVRVGRQRGATRVVVDLTRPPSELTEDGEAIILSFVR